jgi:iron complex outermembrane receptor protein
MNLGDGRLTFTGGFHYNKTKLKQILAAPGPLAAVPGVVLFGRQERFRLIEGQPRTKINLSLDYEQGWFGATARTNRYGEVFAAGGELGPAGSNIFNDLRMQPKWVTDFELRASAGEIFNFAVGANNIFDVYPDQVPMGLAGQTANGTNVFFPATSYVVPYSQFAPFGFNGRFVYGRMSVKF